MKAPAKAKQPSPAAEAPASRPKAKSQAATSGAEAPGADKAVPAAAAPAEAAPVPENEDFPDAPEGGPATKPTGMAELQAASPTASAPTPTGPIRPAPPPKPIGNQGKDFKPGDHVVYPTHGVGQVQGIEEVPVAGMTLKVIIITFEENRMTLKVPMSKAPSSGLRKLASPKMMEEAMDTLRGKARIKRTMWSRRAQEYEQKINSGDPVAIAEVVRDLHRNAGQPDQSFSERQIYELALDRLAMEVAARDGTDKPAATQKLMDHLKQG